MAGTSDLAAASAKLRDAVRSPDGEYDRQIRDHVNYCRQVSSTKEFESIAHNDSLFDNFDPQSDSIAYLFLLRLRIQTIQRASPDTLSTNLLSSESTWSRAAHYLEVFDSVQVRYAGVEWRQLVEFVGKTAQAASQPLLAIRPIRTAMLRLDPSCTIFTSTHLLLVRLCLHSRAYASALPVLDRHVCHFPAVSGRLPMNSQSPPWSEQVSSLSFITEASGLSSGVSYRDYLKYFLYGGLVYMALKEWRKASHFLGIVISTPTSGCASMIMVEAYKKWILVGLIQDGKLCSPPTITTPQVAKLYQSLAKPYVNLAHVFERGDMDLVKAEVEAAKEIWIMDRNMGLVSQAVKSFSRHAVLKMRRTFAALTVADMLEQLSPSPAERVTAESTIMCLIADGALGAKLVHSANSGRTMLRFSTRSASARASHEPKLQAHFKTERQRLRSFMYCLDQGGRSLRLSDEFLGSMQQSHVWASATQEDQEDGENVGLGMDEDIMGD